MSRSTSFFLILITLLVSLHSSPIHAQICAIGCVRAEAKGIPELADSLNRWADVLPKLNEAFHNELRQDFLRMDAIANNLLNRVDRLYGENIDRTSDEIKLLIQEAVRQIDAIGQVAVDRYRELLWETECTASALGQNFSTAIEEAVPRFQSLRKFLFGTRFNILKTTSFSGSPIELEFVPDSASAKLEAEYRLLELRLNSADQSTKMDDLLSVASDLQLAGFKNHCATRAATGAPKFGHFFELWTMSKRQYSDLYFAYRPRIGH